jgi:hypothetical protein
MQVITATLLALLLCGCASVCVVELSMPLHMDCKQIGER